MPGNLVIPPIVLRLDYPQQVVVPALTRTVLQMSEMAQSSPVLLTLPACERIWLFLSLPVHVGAGMQGDLLVLPVVLCSNYPQQTVVPALTMAML
ncbi:hypothetical protein VTH06DRAFT_5456 [Thermothelomyces fergusii]